MKAIRRFFTKWRLNYWFNRMEKYSILADNSIWLREHLTFRAKAEYARHKLKQAKVEWRALL